MSCVLLHSNPAWEIIDLPDPRIMLLMRHAAAIIMMAETVKTWMEAVARAEG